MCIALRRLPKSDNVKFQLPKFSINALFLDCQVESARQRNRRSNMLLLSFSSMTRSNLKDSFFHRSFSFVESSTVNSVLRSSSSFLASFCFIHLLSSSIFSLHSRTAAFWIWIAADWSVANHFLLDFWRANAFWLSCPNISFIEKWEFKNLHSSWAHLYSFSQCEISSHSQTPVEGFFSSGPSLFNTKPSICRKTPWEWSMIFLRTIFLIRLTCESLARYFPLDRVKIGFPLGSTEITVVSRRPLLSPARDDSNRL